MRNRGALAIGVMVLIGVVLASLSVWYHAREGRMCLHFWGVAEANLIRHSPKIEVWKLEEFEVPLVDENSKAPPPSAVTLKIDDAIYKVVRRQTIDEARGLVHARHALIVDANYEWEAGAPAAHDKPLRWTHALRFYDDDNSIVVALSEKHAFVRSLSKPGYARLVPKIAAAEVAFAVRELGPEPAPRKGRRGGSAPAAKPDAPASGGDDAGVPADGKGAAGEKPSSKEDAAKDDAGKDDPGKEADGKASDAKPGEPKPGDAKSGDAKAGDAKPGEGE